MVLPRPERAYSVDAFDGGGKKGPGGEIPTGPSLFLIPYISLSHNVPTSPP
jgi:hypothetical protein